jgi:hypothetical protein
MQLTEWAGISNVILLTDAYVDEMRAALTPRAN